MSYSPEFWLPFAGQVKQLTNDEAGRIWINGGFDSYYYANQKWWNAETLYPNFPDSTGRITFSSECAPLVFRTRAVNTNFGVELLMYQQGEWHPLPDDRILQPTLSEYIANIRFDRNDHLLMQRYFPANYQIWAYGEWTSLTPLDFFPSPGNIYDISIGADNRVYVFTDIGMFVRSGADYRYYPIEDFTEPAQPYFPGHSRFSPQETLWLTYEQQLIRWQNGRGQVIPFVDETVTPSLLDAFLAMEVYSDEDIWLTTSRFGVVHYNGVEMLHYTPGNSGLPAENFNHIAKDDRRRIWLGTNNVVAVMQPGTADIPTVNTATETENFYLFPNPACCQTQVTWYQEVAASTSLQLYNPQGQLLRTLLDAEVPAGQQTVTVQRHDLPAGIYYLVLDQAGKRQTRKLLWK